MSQQQDSKDRAARLVELIVSASKQRLRPFTTWARVVDAAVGGEEPFAVVIGDLNESRQLRAHTTGSMTVVTASFIAHVTFEDLAYALGGGYDDGPFTIDVRRRSDVQGVSLHVPQIGRRSSNWGEHDDGSVEVPLWGAKLHVQLRGSDVPLVLVDTYSTLPLLDLHALLLDGMRRPSA